MAASKPNQQTTEQLRIEALYRAMDYHREYGRGQTPDKVVETPKTFYEFLAGK